ncbi:MAG TPA: MFS transporter [Acidimicrobiales bacterium]|nr:MFS transporter [Acidimicrobiales bacterium]
MTSGRAHDDAPGDRAWAYRNFRILLLGQAVSSLGNTLVPVCLSFAVLALTHRASDLGAVLGCEAGAIVVFLLPAGVLADRWSRRATMVASDALRGTSQAALGLLFVTGHPPLVLVAALAAAGIALYYPAVSGLVPSLVGPGALQRANALQQTVVAAAGVAGPALAGVLVVGVGPGWGLVVDAGTFGLSILTLVALRLEAAPSAGSGRFAASYDWFGSLVAYPVGLAVAGPIADAVGAGRTLVAMGILMLLLSAGLVSLRSVRGLRDEPDAADADAVASPAA